MNYIYIVSVFFLGTIYTLSAIKNKDSFLEWLMDMIPAFIPVVNTVVIFFMIWFFFDSMKEKIKSM